MALALATDNGGIPTVLRLEGTTTDTTFADLWDFGPGSGNGVVVGDTNGNAIVSDFITEIVAGAVYIIQKDIEFGDGTNTLSFASENEMIYFDDDALFTIKTSAVLRLGVLSGEYGINGSMWNVAPDQLLSVIESGQSGTFLCYNSKIKVRSNFAMAFSDGDIDIRNSTLEQNDTGQSNCFFEFDNFDSLILDRVTFTNTRVVRFLKTPDTMNDVHIHRTRFGIFTVLSATIEGVLITAAETADYFNSDVNTLFVLDPVSPVSKPFNLDASGKIIGQRSANIHVTDKDGGDLPNVTVDCEYAHLVRGTDTKAYKCIQDHTSVDAIHKPVTGSDWESFWELYDANGDLGGDWQTTFDFKAGTQEFAQQTTDANGDISEQVIQYKKWVGTSELLEARIHKFTYAHTDYPDSVMSDIIVDHPLVWEFDMGQNIADIIAAVEAAKVTLANGAHGGVDATLALKKMTIENDDFGENAVDITNTNGGSSVKITSDLIGVFIDADNNAVELQANGIGFNITSLNRGIRVRSSSDNTPAVELLTEGANSFGLKLSGNDGDISAAEIAAIIERTNRLPDAPADEGADGDTLETLSDQIDGIPIVGGQPGMS